MTALGLFLLGSAAVAAGIAVALAVARAVLHASVLGALGRGESATPARLRASPATRERAGRRARRAAPVSPLERTARPRTAIDSSERFPRRVRPISQG